MKMTWSVAEKICQGSGGHLVSINAEQEWTFLQMNLQNYFYKSPLYSLTTANILYIGLQKNKADVSFV